MVFDFALCYEYKGILLRVRRVNAHDKVSQLLPFLRYERLLLQLNKYKSELWTAFPLAFPILRRIWNKAALLFFKKYSIDRDIKLNSGVSPSFN